MRLTPLRAVLLIALFTLLAYANSLRNGFVWDDETLVRENSFIRNSTYISAAFTTDLVHNSHGGTAYYRPLQTITYMVDYFYWGLNPVGYHLTNLLLHLLCAILVWLTIRQFTDNPITALVVALIFAVNPINTSAITYVAGRADSLALAGMLGAFLFYRHYREQPDRSHWFFVAALLCYTGALFSRESAMLFPALLLFVTGRPFGRAFRNALPFAVLLFAFIAWRFAVIQLVDKPLTAPWHIPASLRVEIFFRSIATYFGLLLWPVHLQMDRQVAHASHWLTAAGAVCIVTGLIAYWRGNRNVRLGLGWFAIALLPMTGTLNLVATVAEHWLYVPMIGFYFALASIIPWRKLTGAAALLVLLAMTARTIDRNGDWANGSVFFARQTQSARGSERAFTNLGHTLITAGNTDDGLKALRRAEELDPRSATAKYNLAVVHLKRGENELARQKLTECAALDPTDATIWELVAQIHEGQGHHALALRYYRQAISCTRDVATRLRCARFLIRHSHAKEALALLDECAYLEPGNAAVYRLLSEILHDIGQTTQATAALDLASSLDRHS